jgi:hypothetical protein
MPVFLDVTSCTFVRITRCFGGVHYFYLQGTSNINGEHNPRTVLKKAVVSFSETMVDCSWYALGHSPQDWNLRWGYPSRRVLLATSYSHSLFEKCCNLASLYVLSCLAPPVNGAQFTFVYRYCFMFIFCCEAESSRCWQYGVFNAAVSFMHSGVMRQ